MPTSSSSFFVAASKSNLLAAPIAHVHGEFAMRTIDSDHVHGLYVHAYILGAWKSECNGRFVSMGLDRSGWP